VDAILAVAKNLRQSPSYDVRQYIYFNKHMTRAESLAAFNAREKKRNKINKVIVSRNSDDVAAAPTPSTSGMAASKTTTQSDNVVQDMDIVIPAQTSDIVPGDINN
jgi:hypothetical protein